MATRLGARPWPRLLVATAVLAAAATLAAACGSSGSNDQGQGPTATGGDVTIAPGSDVTAGGSVVFGLEAESSGWDPTTDRWAPSGLDVAYAIYDPLSAYDADGTTRPYLAQSFDHSDDFLQWTIHVRPNITFHDGEPLDGAAVAKSLNAVMGSALTGAALRNIDTVEVSPSDPMAVVVTMKAPWASFPATLVSQVGVIVAPAQLDASPEERSSHPIGTGPFVYKEWTPDKNFVATRNDHYWMTDDQGRSLPYLDQIEFRPIPDNQNRVNALQAGDVDMLSTSDDVAIATLQGLADQGKIQAVEDHGENDKTFLMFNSSKPPFDNVTARRAVAYATNYAAFLQTFQIPPEQAVDSAFNKDSPFYYDAGFPTYDAAKARELVQQYQDETGQQLSFTLATPTVPSNVQAGQLLAQWYSEVGMDVKLDSVEQSQYISDALVGNFQADLWRQFGAQDPDGNYVWWHEKNVSTNGPSLNIAHFANDQLSAALDKARATDDMEVRKEQYKIVQQVWADQVPYVWLYTTRWMLAASNEVRNITNVALPDTNGAATIPALPFQTGTQRLTMTWKAA